MKRKKKLGAPAAQAAPMLTAIPSWMVMRVLCPTCDEISDVTGPDFDLRLWPHNMSDGRPCRDGASKRTIREALAARSAPLASTRRTRRSPEQT